MAGAFSDEEQEDVKKKLDSGELKLDYNAIIVYNEEILRKKYEELIQENDEKEVPTTQEEIDKVFYDYVKGVITHERCHLNNQYYVTEVIPLTKR